MFRKVLMLTVLVSAFLACRLQAAVINSNWVGGSQGEWETASNWNPAIVPDNNATNTFAVTINAGAGKTRVGLQEWHTIDRLDCYGEVDLEKWTSSWVELIIYNGLTNHGYLEIDSDIQITGNVTNLVGASLELCGMDIEGNLYNQAGASIDTDDEVEINKDDEGYGGNLENAGIITVGPISDLWVEQTLHNIGQINVYGGVCGGDEVFDNNSTGVITGFGVLASDQLVRNKGQITAYGGSLVVVVVASEGSLINTGLLRNDALSSLHIKPGLLEPAMDINNSGTIEVSAGGGVAFDCNLVNNSSGIIKLLGGTLAATTITQAADANFTGFGGITGNVVIGTDGLIKLTGPTNIVGDVNIPAGATLKISDGQTLITGHTICDGTIQLIGGTVIFQGGCDCDGCNIINEAGTDRNHFDINADGIENFKDFASFANTWLWQASWY